MARGRPPNSRIRQNIVEILHVIGKGYGYQIHKFYQELYPPCTREVIYYHLHKGVVLEEFQIEEIKEEPGDYSWGKTVEKTYYVLGKNAMPKGDVKAETLR